MAVEFDHAFGRESAVLRKFEDTIWKLLNCESTVSWLVLVREQRVPREADYHNWSF